MYPYQKYLDQLETENSLKRSYLQSQLSASRSVAQPYLFHSRIFTQERQHFQAKKNILRRSKAQAQQTIQNADLKRQMLLKQHLINLQDEQKKMRLISLQQQMEMEQAQKIAEQKRIKLEAQIQMQKKLIQQKNRKKKIEAQNRIIGLIRQEEENRKYLQKLINQQRIKSRNKVERAELQVQISAKNMIKQQQILRRSRIQHQLEMQRAANLLYQPRRTQINPELQQNLFYTRQFQILQQAELEKRRRQEQLQRLKTQKAIMILRQKQRRQMIQNDIEAEYIKRSQQLKKSRMENELETIYQAKAAILRRSRIEAQLEAERIHRSAVLRRSRVQAEIAEQNAVRRQQLEAQIQMAHWKRMNNY